MSGYLTGRFLKRRKKPKKGSNLERDQLILNLVNTLESSCGLRIRGQAQEGIRGESNWPFSGEKPLEGEKTKRAAAFKSSESWLLEVYGSLQGEIP